MKDKRMCYCTQDLLYYLFENKRNKRTLALYETKSAIFEEINLAHMSCYLCDVSKVKPETTEAYFKSSSFFLLWNPPNMSLKFKVFPSWKEKRLRRNRKEKWLILKGFGARRASLHSGHFYVTLELWSWRHHLLTNTQVCFCCTGC